MRRVPLTARVGALRIPEVHLDATGTTLTVTLEVQALPSAGGTTHIAMVQTVRAACPYDTWDEVPSYLQAQIARDLMVRILVHELDEQLEFEGVRLFDPHANLHMTRPAVIV